MFNHSFSLAALLVLCTLTPAIQALAVASTEAALLPRAAPTVTVTRTSTKTIAKTTKTSTATSTKKVTITATSVATSTITKPASTITKPASTTTVRVTASAEPTTVMSTVTQRIPPPAGPPGHQYIPNSLFEDGDGSSDWCRNRDPSICKIVQRSKDDSFSGAFGSGMLVLGRYRGNLKDIKVPLPVLQYPNPSGKDWVVTVFFRAESQSDGRCATQLDLMNEAGTTRWLGEGRFVAAGPWIATSVELPDSAKGAAAPWGVVLGALCLDDASSLYVDGIVAN
ncbi:hypothetical protein LIA77_10762 [Sarocladium implicatum]|nr:hypothetical protein LIA77_10762 [Sarocladium implicatum]